MSPFSGVRIVHRLRNREEAIMEAVILLGLGVLTCAWAWQSGKRDGSRKAYRVGWQRAKRIFGGWFRKK